MSTAEAHPPVRLVFWEGTTQREAYPSDYNHAMAIIADRHRNAIDPAFYEARTGRELFDDGFGIGYMDDDGRRTYLL